MDPKTMLRTFLRSKIHRATVTDANLEYEGSITIDQSLMEAAGLAPYELVHVLNLHNGERFETYVITGKRNSGTMCVNGAAARLAQKGDKIIVVAYGLVEGVPTEKDKPVVVHVDANNRAVKKPRKG
jgi:aspartate 1-decarboxylase